MPQDSVPPSSAGQPDNSRDGARDWLQKRITAAGELRKLILEFRDELSNLGVPFASQTETEFIGAQSETRIDQIRSERTLRRTLKLAQALIVAVFVALIVAVFVALIGVIGPLILDQFRVGPRTQAATELRPEDRAQLREMQAQIGQINERLYSLGADMNRPPPSTGGQGSATPLSAPVVVVCPDPGSPARPTSSSADSQTFRQPCPTPEKQAGQAPKEPEILARWVQLIPKADTKCDPLGGPSHDAPGESETETSCEPRLMARAVLPKGADCAKIATRPGTGEPVKMSKRRNPDEERFAVTVCEAELNTADQAVQFADGTRISWAGLERLERVVVLGDTGCDNPDAAQRCADGEAWPFRRIATAAEAGPEAPDLVVHVGDYRYREGDNGDTWENWKADFFDPAAGLLAAAPWVMVRGNHEVCYKTQGPGWFFLLQPAIGTVGACAKDPLSHPDNLPPHALDFGLKSEGDNSKDKWLRFVVLDSANTKYRCDTWARDFNERYRYALRDLLDQKSEEADATDKKVQRDVWLLTHYPVWDVSEAYVGGVDDAGWTKMRRCESQFWAGGSPTSLGSTFPYRAGLVQLIKEHNIRVVLSGDTHQFQVLGAHGSAGQANNPPALQIVAGNGGTRLWPVTGPSGSSPHTCETEHGVRYFQRKLDDGSIFGKAVCAYGYVRATFEGLPRFELKSVADLDDPAKTSCVLGDASCYLKKAECVLLGPNRGHPCDEPPVQPETGGRPTRGATEGLSRSWPSRPRAN